MLDTDTKRRIDSARDILVGKVPDPKSQVEQITIALIYKFMDDMDAEAEELGGKRKFFTADFARYGWAKLMRSGLGGHETLALYGEGITKMTENPGLPPLFRDIFKNAYLPYRDPETLKAFLKIIDEFTYDHSERLGDAFEYLLSVLGSQGDAGQFRTPRHIIDFIVEIVDPKKEESVLDPACGTAGFLISAYKHILSKNTDAAGRSQLTPDERGRLAKNFKGYDISPDMVRLSLVNLYLHGFTDPHIYEYDSLTSEDRWNEFADVILANPPFMSPKGGIKPHRRFSIQAKRSEVLFVDYMAEHLTPQGRAGIIVPEGIIFQSQTAYKELRKMLVDSCLVAVISLPAGCFNPYSGVKTSILILDKGLAKQARTVAFFKVENDGFGLGAQRRAIEKNDLPQVQTALAAYLQALRTGASPETLTLITGLIVPKEKIAGNGEYNLSGERYRDGVLSVSSWPFVSVKDAFRKADQTVLPESLDGPVTYLGLENITQKTGDIEGSVLTEKPSEIKSLKNVFKPRDILYGKLRPNLNKVWLADRNGICSTDIFVIEAIEGRADPALYAYLFRSARFNDAVMGQLKGAQLPRIGWSSFAELQIPLPPLEVQQEIVAEIEGYQKVINGARAVLDHYRPHIPIHPDWPMAALGEFSEVTSSKRILAEEYVPSGTPFYRTKEIVELSRGHGISLELFISRERFESIKARFGAPAKGELLISAVGTIGVSWVVADNREFYFKDGNLLWIRNLTNLDPYFLKHCLDSTFAGGIDHIVFGAAYKALTIEKLKDFKIPLPPLATQRAIVAEIEAEQALVAANRELITRFERKIQATLARVWGEETPSASEATMS
jgi:type I restriction enzyme M protein